MKSTKQKLEKGIEELEESDLRVIRGGTDTPPLDPYGCCKWGPMVPARCDNLS